MHSTILAFLSGILFFNFGHALDWECIMVVGAQLAPSSMEYFCPLRMDENCVLGISPLRGRADHVAGMLDGDVILAGGQHSISTETFNPESWEQKKQEDMVGALPSLGYAGAAVLNGSFYVCGGGPFNIGSDEVRNICMTYKSGHWAGVEPMKYARKGHGFVAVDHYLYAFGGIGKSEPDGPYHPVHLSSMERFNTQTKKWEEMASMLTPRRYFGSAVLGSSFLSAHIYACGGTDWQQSFSSCERYDAEKNRWNYLANMTIQRQQFTLTPFNGKLYAIGGFLGDQQGRLNIGHSVEAYDPDKYDPHRNTWVLVGNLTVPRAGHSATLVQFKSSISNICSKPTTSSTTTTTAKPGSASMYSPINITSLLFLGFWAIKAC